MPPQIGRFISDAIYDGQLDSNPLHPITNERMACHFINIPSQEQLHGTSWKVSRFVLVPQSCTTLFVEHWRMSNYPSNCGHDAGG